MMMASIRSSGIWSFNLSFSSSRPADPSIAALSFHSSCRAYSSVSSSFSSLSDTNFSHKSSVPQQPNSVADKVLAHIRDSGIIACLRAQSADAAIEAASAALRGGISVLEVVMSTPGVFEVIQCLVQDYPSASIGVGTVLDRQDAKDAIKFGAKFLMSPATVKDILDVVAEGQALYIPGVMTPTEILLAYNAGAKIVKVYPVSALGGVQYIAALRKPFPHIPVVASQGIMIDSVGQYIAHGASSVVLSDAIFDKNALAQLDFDRINQLAHFASSVSKEAIERRKDGLS